MAKASRTTRITLDLPNKLHKQVKAMANEKGETLRQLFIELAEHEIAQQNQISENPFQRAKSKRKQPPALKLGITDEQIDEIIKNTWLPKF